MLVLLRLGTLNSNHAIVGVILAKAALVYEALSVAVCHDIIVGVVVVSEHFGEIGLFTVTRVLQIAGVVPAAPCTVKV
jgi:hypothetical protein